MDSDILKEITIDEELRTSIKLIELGFGELQQLDSANDFYHLPLQLLASGFERLMKCHICYGYLEQNNTFPDLKYLKGCGGKGHDLIELKKNILESYFNTPSPALKDDYNFLKDDERLNTLIDILSEFGKYARYYNFDVITDNAKPSRDVQSEWKKFEDDILLSEHGMLEKLVNLETQNEAFQFIGRELIVILEKFVRGICRQFTLGRLGAKAQQHSSILFPFILLQDDQLGNKDYRTKSTSKNSKQISGYQRTEEDETKRRNNPNYKYKRLLKEEFDGDWPFYHDEIIIECRDKYWCVVTIEGRDYALNAAAVGRFKLENVHDAGMAILGKPISQFIQMASNL